MSVRVRGWRHGWVTVEAGGWPPEGFKMAPKGSLVSAYYRLGMQCQVHSRVARSNTTPLQAQPDAGQRGRRSPRHPGKASVLPSIVGTDLHKRVVALLLAAER